MGTEGRRRDRSSSRRTASIRRGRPGTPRSPPGRWRTASTGGGDVAVQPTTTSTSDSPAAAATNQQCAMQLATTLLADNSTSITLTPRVGFKGKQRPEPQAGIPPLSGGR